ncbi:hypothetical protein EEB15_24380 [Ramlibacter sp. WS9]|nr:hypothetical protein EEB15_24380 [Ramlibacter sp. WS9]
MRTSLDLPDALYRHLKARAAMESTSLRDLVVSLIERGLDEPGPRIGDQPPALPSVRLGAPLALASQELSNARLAELLDDQAV